MPRLCSFPCKLCFQIKAHSHIINLYEISARPKEKPRFARKPFDDSRFINSLKLKLFKLTPGASLLTINFSLSPKEQSRNRSDWGTKRRRAGKGWVLFFSPKGGVFRFPQNMMHLSIVQTRLTLHSVFNVFLFESFDIWKICNGIGRKMAEACLQTDSWQ